MVRQRRWRRLATEYAGVDNDKLPDYLRSDTKDGNEFTFLDIGKLNLAEPYNKTV